MEQLKRLAIMLAFAVCTALLSGGTGSVVGFLEPMLITVLVGLKANLGPLWGIYVLGPSGVLLDFFVGAFVGQK